MRHEFYESSQTGERLSFVDSNWSVSLSGGVGARTLPGRIRVNSCHGVRVWSISYL